MEVFKKIKGIENYEFGDLGSVKSLKRRRVLEDRIIKGSLSSNGYLFVSINGKNRSIHQLITMAFLNHKPCKMKAVVNHKNHITTDNRLENLEIISHRENCSKRKKRGTSRFTGVCWEKNYRRWKSQIRINGISKHLGYYLTELEASNKYQTKLKEIK